MLTRNTWVMSSFCTFSSSASWSSVLCVSHIHYKAFWSSVTRSILKLEGQIVCYLLVPAARWLDFTAWAYFFRQRTRSRYPELLDFCATGKCMIKVQALFYFIFFCKAPYRFASTLRMCSVPLCGTETSPVLIAKGTWVCALLCHLKSYCSKTKMGNNKTIYLWLGFYLPPLRVFLGCWENTEKIAFQWTSLCDKPFLFPSLLISNLVLCQQCSSLPCCPLPSRSELTLALN